MSWPKEEIAHAFPLVAPNRLSRCTGSGKEGGSVVEGAPASVSNEGKDLQTPHRGWKTQHGACTKSPISIGGLKASQAVAEGNSEGHRFPCAREVTKKMNHRSTPMSGTSSQAYLGARAVRAREE